MNLRSRADRLVLLVLGIALGARIASPLTSQLDAIVALALVFAVALVLVAPVRPLTARELSHEVKRMVAAERRRFGPGPPEPAEHDDDEQDRGWRQRQEPTE